MESPASIVISIFALFASGGGLCVHYVNLLERRHGDAARMRADQMRKMSDLRSRIISCQTNIETLRLEVRKVPDCAQKYEIVEAIPNVLKSCEGCLKAVATAEEYYGQLDTKSMKTSALLFLLQRSDATHDSMLEMMRANEEAVLKMLVSSRISQGATQANPAPDEGPAL